MVLATAPGPTTDVATTSVVVIDDHRTFAELLAVALDGEPDIRCVGTAVDARSALALVHDRQPDVVVVDIEMPGQNGLAITRAVLAQRPATVVVVVTAHTDPVWLARASQAGASGFVPKNGSLDEVVTAVRSARPGAMHVAPSALSGPVTRVQEPRETTGIRLTEREHEVLSYLCGGLAPKAIARLLGITVNTARGYVKAIFAKLEVGSQVEAVLKAQRLGLVPAAT